MKFRTDFVTNSSSSGFCVCKVVLANGQTIKYYEDCEPAFAFDMNYSESKVRQISTVQDLWTFLNNSYSNGTNESLEDTEFHKEFIKIGSLNEVKAFGIEYNYFYDEIGNVNGSVSMNFETGQFDVKRYEPDAFDEEYE